MAVRLKWEDVAPGDASALVVRHSGFRSASITHSHDFAELFIVESGSADHVVTDVVSKVEMGDIVFVSPDDTHRYLVPTADFVIVNVAFPAHLLSWLSEQIAEVGRAFGRPRCHPSLGPSEHLRLVRFALEVGDASSPLGLVRFIAEVLTTLELSHPSDHAPLWLGRSLAEWRNDPDAIRDGVSAIARLAGRSREHVSRTIRKSTGTRAVDLVNEARMESAATLLLTSDDSISSIAHRVGIASVTHFYTLFRRQFGTTPHRYRLLRREIVDPSRDP